MKGVNFFLEFYKFQMAIIFPIGLTVGCELRTNHKVTNADPRLRMKIVIVPEKKMDITSMTNSWSEMYLLAYLFSKF